MLYYIVSCYTILDYVPEALARQVAATTQRVFFRGREEAGSQFSESSNLQKQYAQVLKLFVVTVAVVTVCWSYGVCKMAASTAAGRLERWALRRPGLSGGRCAAFPLGAGSSAAVSHRRSSKVARLALSQCHCLHHDLQTYLVKWRILLFTMSCLTLM